MTLKHSAWMLALMSGAALFAPMAAHAQTRPPSSSDPTSGKDTQLEEVIVTAQKRESSVQNTPLSITAVTGATLAKSRILSTEDLANSQVGVSFTQNSPQALEINIRGVVNTRLTAPTADQSVSTFVDDVYVSRSGNLNSNFYDVQRIEVVRGPQGVLLGKNVTGGAISVYSAPPLFTPSGAGTLTFGNYDLKQFSGFVTGPIAQDLAARFSVQAIDHSGYARDLQHNVDLEDLDSVQLRAQLLYTPQGTGFRGSLIVDYDHDFSNGPNRVGVGETTFTTPSQPFEPWYKARQAIIAKGVPLTIRESFPTWPTFAGDTSPSPQAVKHESYNGILKLEKDNVLPDVTLTSITGYRHGRAYTLYDQSGIGPGNIYGVTTPLLFAEPVNFIEQVDQVSQEVRLTSKYPNSRFDWIAGVYYLHTDVHQLNRFWGLSTALASLSGESHWDDHGHSEDIAVFAQGGFKITNQLKLEVGLRYTHDHKNGNQVGTAVALGDAINPNDKVPLTPLTAVPGFNTDYGHSWEKLTPQATLTYKPWTDLLIYGTVSTGFKGGGFQNDAPNAFAAQTPYRPESLTNYEGGFKWEFWHRRARWNSSVFYMDYTDLQVQRTDGTCLCNVIANAGEAQIKGFETEFELAPTHWSRFWLSGSALDATYTDYVDPVTKVNYDGKFLQRTPRYQIGVGGEVSAAAFGYTDDLRLHVNYKYQGKLSWAPDNVQFESPYGLLDARLTYAPANRNWALSMWVRNMTDEVYRTNIIDILGDSVSSFGAPRTFGGDITVRF